MTSVVKRDGRREAVSFDKILGRIASLAEGLANVEAITRAFCAAIASGAKSCNLQSPRPSGCRTPFFFFKFGRVKLSS